MVTQVGLSDLEELVARWLTKRKIPFESQVSVRGGVFALGGAKIDFIIPGRRLAWRVFGEYWHKGVEKTGQDILQKEMLSELGFVVVDLLSDDILNRLEATMIKALQGVEMLR